MVKNKTLDLVLSALGAVLIAVCSWISVPGTVPFTMQTFAVYFLLCLLGAKTGLQAIIVYIAIGAIGAPVFSGFCSGIGVLTGVTGGYIVGFIFIGVIYAVSEKFYKNRLSADIISLSIGTLVCYTFGTVWFTVVYAGSNGEIGFWAVLMRCVVPFILPDAVKLALAIMLSRKLKPILLKNK